MSIIASCCSRNSLNESSRVSSDFQSGVANFP